MIPLAMAQTRRARAFSLVEAAISIIIVATMFAAGMAAAGSAARDRLIQSEIRQGQSLAAQLLAEITQQRYADPSQNTIAPFPGVSTTDRSNWTHIDDYAGFKESPPTDRSGRPVPGAASWAWKADIAYQTFSNLSGASASSGGVVGGLIGAVGGIVSGVIDATLSSPTDTGLKQIVVTVTAPSGKKTTLTAMRCSAGVVDRTSTGFHDFAALNITIGPEQRAITTGASLLNTPPSP